MSTTIQPNDSLDFNDGQKPQLPTTLNVLTILTIIGSVIGIISGLWSYFTIDKSYKQLLDSRDKLSEAPAWAKGFLSPEMIEATRKSMENKLPIMLLTVIGSALCLYGALEMRKLKKQGFVLWLTGEFLPLAGTLIFIGTGLFSGFGLIGLAFPLIFLILYATQKKNLLY